MPDPAAPPATPPAAPPTAPPAAPPANPPAPQDPPAPPAGTYTQADLDRKVKEALDAKIEADKKAAEIEEAKRKGEWEKVSAADKERADKAEAKARTLAAKTDVLAGAIERKIVDADVAFQLIQSKVEFDAEGNPKNIPALLDQLVKDKPFLIGQSDSSTSPGNPAGGRSGSFTVEAIRKMSADEINANWDKPGFQEALKRR